MRWTACLLSPLLALACNDARTPGASAEVQGGVVEAPKSDDGVEPDEGAAELSGEGPGDEGEDPDPEPKPEPEPIKLAAPDGTPMLDCDEGPEEMGCIPGGAFIRGSDEGPENARPRADIWIQTFWMDRNEVTYAEYKACEKAGECPRSGPQYLDFDRPQQPINGISWFDAQAYCGAQGKRLPTEAEWEKAARGTDGRLYPWGDEEATCELAIIKGEEGRGCGLLKKGKKPETGRVWPVGSRAPNQFGLYDMSGNSFEWVADWYTRSYEECGEACQGLDPKGPCDGAEDCPGYKHKIIRGGSWYWPAEKATTIFRRAHVPRNQPFHHFGFRCAADLEQASRVVMLRAAEADLAEAAADSPAG